MSDKHVWTRSGATAESCFECEDTGWTWMHPPRGREFQTPCPYCRPEDYHRFMREQNER